MRRLPSRLFGEISIDDDANPRQKGVYSESEIRLLAAKYEEKIITDDGLCFLHAIKSGIPCELKAIERLENCQKKKENVDDQKKSQAKRLLGAATLWNPH